MLFDDDLYATTASPQSTDTMPSIAEMQAMMRQFKSRRETHLLAWGEAFEKCKCHVCGRKPFLFTSGGRDTIGCCSHTYEAIKAQVRVFESQRSTITPLWAIGIEVVP